MSKKLKETSDRVWLAGLGALAVAEQEGNDLFQQLVRKGREVEKATEREKSSRSEPWIMGLRVSSELSDLAKETKVIGAYREKAEEGHSPLEKFLPTAQERAMIEARQARRLAAARRAFLKEFSGTERPPSDWERLQGERKIFTVTHRGATYVPSFQFDEKGKPRSAVAKVIEILGKNTSDWGLALWFTAASGRLAGKRPVDLLSAHPEEVIQAAEQEAAELVF
jgi:poly(hydroxyalkanoate) granule-associated protein